VCPQDRVDITRRKVRGRCATAGRHVGRVGREEGIGRRTFRYAWALVISFVRSVGARKGRKARQGKDGQHSIQNGQAKRFRMWARNETAPCCQRDREGRVWIEGTHSSLARGPQKGSPAEISKRREGSGEICSREAWGLKTLSII